ncbi:hypothetical protein TTHERM_000834934 (macronuclear) [Tetrahymena thermophila SB210]|uniref:Uncharacterized protein n=1 Tax=Tetrahymena thermophila (strain SB210) TaxID=312017 RepID=W7XDD6_TETTS|nr:hypothetical protein TTHERM_000834934 [Tetrahymena thermophila SB210]EWS75542.1 hypothetical protein TTHERM_000834934 [Tetrahymena thermophila SB210]|eukprot:XP_012651908.1 hypothetical protein TTHERM_000834934 [Tetrahymena thermophila SB210]
MYRINQKILIKIIMKKQQMQNINFYQQYLKSRITFNKRGKWQQYVNYQKFGRDFKLETNQKQNYYKILQGRYQLKLELIKRKQRYNNSFRPKSKENNSLINQLTKEILQKYSNNIDIQFMNQQI